MMWLSMTQEAEFRALFRRCRVEAEEDEDAMVREALGWCPHQGWTALTKREGQKVLDYWRNKG